MTSKHTPGPLPSARSNPPHGYKALILHPHPHIGERYRTEVLTKHGHWGIGHNFKTRENAIAYAKLQIAHRAVTKAIKNYQPKQARLTGRRPTEDEARAAIAKARGGGS